VGGTLVLALSASDTTVFPAPTAALVTPAAEAAGDSTTSVFGNFLLNSSWLEVFFPLSDVVGQTLLMIGYLSKQQTECGNAELSHWQDC
jgi:hypothetical protein